MVKMKEIIRPAMKIEEAALLPALPRHLSGQAALESVMRAAEAMGGMRVSNAVEGSINAPCVIRAKNAGNTYRPLQSRAALHHILKR